MSEAAEAIRTLLGRYCELMDAGAWADVGAWVEAAEVAEAIAYVASPAARNITATTLLIDGGMWS